VVIWRTAQDKADAKTPLIVVECKADNITIKAADYAQGEAYSLYCNAPFFVTHNNRETRYWRTRKERMPGHCEEIENIPHADASDRDIQELIAKLRAFKEDEFADLLHSCHNVIRNREHLDPAAAFDEIAKVLFVKVTFERRLRPARQNLFTADFLDAQRQVSADPVKTLFDETNKEYAGDRIFDARDEIKLVPFLLQEFRDARWNRRKGCSISLRKYRALMPHAVKAGHRNGLLCRAQVASIGHAGNRWLGLR
jgi:type I restriction enzyme M protein